MLLCVSSGIGYDRGDLCHGRRATLAVELMDCSVFYSQDSIQ
ncbi:MAG: hypothetical protein QG552_2159 [Thermodesulfobacteriota bacterium]|nr:hypothetical protein [Thermodesulfobacteriota bacterium]